LGLAGCSSFCAESQNENAAEIEIKTEKWRVLLSFITVLWVHAEYVSNRIPVNLMFPSHSSVPFLILSGHVSNISNSNAGGICDFWTACYFEAAQQDYLHKDARQPSEFF
jgi:hypothetical protein